MTRQYQHRLVVTERHADGTEKVRVNKVYKTNTNARKQAKRWLAAVGIERTATVTPELTPEAIERKELLRQLDAQIAEELSQEATQVAERLKAEPAKPTMAEVNFRVAAITENYGRGFNLYSRNAKDEVSYFHGYFELMEEALYSVEMRCEKLGIRFVQPYAKRLIEEGMF